MHVLGVQKMFIHWDRYTLKYMITLFLCKIQSGFWKYEALCCVPFSLQEIKINFELTFFKPKFWLSQFGIIFFYQDIFTIFKSVGIWKLQSKFGLDWQYSEKCFSVCTTHRFIYDDRNSFPFRRMREHNHRYNYLIF